ncbi:putative lysozyme C milk isozyme-like [Scophthalmus maximus]|uniref:lysozyme n=1 Tax=Scophthalmus maximus TaxID=52904 RepID=A0A2U9BLQ5_SCOMX|nr:putative lysozyme C milk isozyme-like [Scophthalmus maximus]KAF0036876.1 hypothetical protein F2P81_009750 [Scophthalmus maximus]
MRPLVVLLLALLGCGRAELQAKCQLRKQLLKAVGDLAEDARRGFGENLLAKIVCHAELATGFNTSALSNHLVCSDGSTQRPNICAIDCSHLADDDVLDDITCLLKILNDLIDNGFTAPHWEPLRRMVRIIFQDECRDTQAGDYFADCTSPGVA